VSSVALVFVMARMARLTVPFAVILSFITAISVRNLTMGG
jgi:hypothetical protein